MLKFFSINDVFRLLFVFVILAGIRLPFVLLNDDIMTTELSNLIVGHKMSEGMLIYKSIVDFTAPLSALVYHGLFWLFGKSFTALQVVSLFIVMIQTVIFNYWINKLELLTEKSYYPSVLFVIIASSTMEFQTLSPMMMATTFLMIAIFKALEVIRQGDVSEVAYQTGIYLGIAILFYSPMVFFVIPLLISLLAYSNIKPKKYIVYVYGILFPLLFVGVFFMWKDALSVYLIDIFYYGFSLSKNVLVSLSGVLISFLILILLSIGGFQKGLFSQRYISFQKSAITLCFFVVFGFLLLIAFAPTLSYDLFYALVPIASYYLAILFDVSYITRKIEFAFMTCLLFLGLGGYIHFMYEGPFEKAIVKPSAIGLQGKVLVLGDDISLYANEGVMPTTGFVNWQLSRRYFINDIESIEGKVGLFVKRDTPKYIQDQEGVLESVEEVHWFNEMYSKKSEGLYVLKNKK